MQIFLPYSDIEKSVRALDNRRLAKQTVECIQIIKALTMEDAGWKSHPAVKMVRNHAGWVHQYADATVRECSRRNIDRTKSRAHLLSLRVLTQRQLSYAPSWFGDDDFHRAHRSNLVRKDSDFYFPRFVMDDPEIDGTLDYIWPICKCSVCKL